MEHPAYSQLRQISQSVGVVLCPNPSYSSLEGTNSYVIKAEGDSRSIVIDPGPEDEGHLNVLQRYAGDVALILLTHRHGDHADGAARFRQLTGAPIRELESQYCAGGQDPLVDGERIVLDGVTPQIEVVATPGHTADSVCYFIHTGDGEDDVEGIVTGDTIAGRHTTMISETDGDLGKYMETLEMLDTRGKGVRLLPGHGADLPDITVMTQKYIERRKLRLQQVKDAVAKLGDEATVDQIVDEIYTDVDPVLRHAAEQSTRVTLRYLRDHGE
ncbi:MULTISPECIES: MBL fold metallo-hydrolase [Corynebacterium]|uniref:MBL fold metallo-hydrolase n=1 Tax=Corynebacterium amycolatum TaxID=43765 RepID=A0AB38XW56_CORAY|nr:MULTISPECIES: MBL fold metallo-hydrolase [Corynebacterium]AIN82498.1 metallo-beta-lactamase superfamily protein [Corynebacterium sp. ATCC 6931]KAA9267349.1 MBL fold metallo-hydrolase [Corynebacterium amycolatum]MBC6726091.1 MBL fold metallo-hydrolase [Corynebacterium amycolatum]MBU5624172.1 MBL fold metallo-hydrolase [Corynebacterium amycolatum]MCG7244686.1 MBL fold metallo-hydrolase [Corynebacterium sp. ACRPX]